LTAVLTAKAPVFIEEINANAVGYQKLAEAIMGK